MFKRNKIRAKQLYLKLDESNTYFTSSHIVSKTPYFVFIFLATLLLELFLDYPDARNAALIYLVVLIVIRILIAMDEAFPIDKNEYESFIPPLLLFYLLSAVLTVCYAYVLIKDSDARALLCLIPSLLVIIDLIEMIIVFDTEMPDRSYPLYQGLLRCLFKMSRLSKSWRLENFYIDTVNGRLNSLLLEPQFSSDKWLALTSVHRARRIFTKYSELSTFTLLTNKGYATELNETLRLLEEILVVINKAGDIATQEELIYTLINLLDKLDMILPDSCSIEPKSTKKRLKDARQVDEKTVLERARKFNDNWS